MNLDEIETKCFILALFIRDDDERFLLGSRAYEFKDSQLHFVANMYQNDIVEVQGNDGVMLAGQVRRGNTQTFDGYIGDSTVNRSTIEQYRRNFMKFFRKNHYYKVVYIFADGTAIQRRKGFIVEAPEVKELYQLFPEYHIGMNFEDINYYAYEEDSEGQEIYGKSANLKIATSATGGLIWENGSETTVSGEGSNFTLDDTLAGFGISDVQLKGDTTQNGTPTPSSPLPVNTVTGRQVVTISDGDSQSQSHEVNLGKNLLDLYSATTSNPTRMTIAINEPAVSYNITTVTGTGVGIIFDVNIEAGKTYTLKVSHSAGVASNNIRISNGDWNTSGSYQGINVANTFGDGATFTANSDYTKLRIWILNSDNDGVDTGSISYIQLEKGSVASAYTPYISHFGKNIIDPSALNFIDSNVSASYTTLTTLPTGIRYKTTYPDGGPYVMFKIMDISSYVGKTIRMKATFGEKGEIQIATMSSDASQRNVVAQTATSNTEISYVVPDNLGDNHYLGYRLRIYPASGNDTVDFTNLIMTIDNDDISYQQFIGGQIELCKIGTYQDYIYKSGDDWYVHKETNKLVFDGSDDEQWGLATNSRFYCNANMYSGGVLPASNTGDFNAYSNSFIADNYNTSWNSITNGTICVAANGTSNPRMVNTNYTTLDSFKSWLSSNPVSLYYPLVTATDIQITDSSVVAQLNALAGATTYDGQTIFTVTSENQLGILSLTATIVDGGGIVWDSIGATWEEGTGGGPTIVTVDSIDNVYPVWELTGPAVNPQISVLTTNTTLSYAGSVTSSQTLKIDMFNKTATLNGASVIGNVSGDWVYLKPGVNRITYTTGNADAPDSTIWWQEIVG